MSEPCPACLKRLTKLPKGEAPLPDCKCRVCRWLRDNSTYEGPRRG